MTSELRVSDVPIDGSVPARLSIPAIAEELATSSRDFRWSAAPAADRTSLAALEPNVRRLDPRIAAVLERCFDRLSGRDSNIDLRELKSGLELHNEYLAERILCVLDSDGDGLIDREDFLGSIRTLLCGSARERLSFAFRIHDLDADKALDRAEIQRMIVLGLAEDSLETQLGESERLTDLLLQSTDRNQDGRISFGEFEAAVQRHAPVLEQIAQSGLIWIAPDAELREHLESFEAPDSLRERLGARALGVMRSIENNAVSLGLLASWALLNAFLCERALAIYSAAGAPLSLQIARAAGACLNLNCALLLVPVLRLALTWLRRTRQLRFIPIDHALAFHRLLGQAVFVLALVHTAAHLCFADPSLSRDPIRVIDGIEFGKTGIALLFGLVVLWLGALPALRRRNFELFHRSHLIYLLFFPLLLLHGRQFWAWALLPGALFAVDRLLRASRQTHQSHVVSASALRSQVTRLELARPAGFVHRPTDYLFLRIPAIAAHEWHPFTISSAPEQATLSIHVRSLGNWTSQLHRLIGDRDHDLRAEIDGPYGAPCASIFEARHAVLIGAGIGATPFASVLESLARGGASQLEKLHFFWINRDQRSFEWFRELLASIERTDAGRRIDIRIHMTRGRRDAASAIVSLARELAHASGSPDLVTGLKARTRMGHPNFKQELHAIAAQHAPNTVCVFFCGPPGLARKVRRVCLNLGMPFRQEHF